MSTAPSDRQPLHAAGQVVLQHNVDHLFHVHALKTVRSGSSSVSGGKHTQTQTARHTRTGSALRDWAWACVGVDTGAGQQPGWVDATGPKTGRAAVRRV